MTSLTQEKLAVFNKRAEDFGQMLQERGNSELLRQYVGVLDAMADTMTSLVASYEAARLLKTISNKDA